MNIASKLEAVLYIGPPTALPGSVSTNNVPEEISTLTYHQISYTYAMDGSDIGDATNKGKYMKKVSDPNTKGAKK